MMIQFTELLVHNQRGLSLICLTMFLIVKIETFQLSDQISVFMSGDSGSTDDGSREVHGGEEHRQTVVQVEF